jgi:uncharacterized protein (AIM24 family)
MDRFSWDYSGTGSNYDLLLGKDSDGRFVLCWLRLGGTGGTVITWPGDTLSAEYLQEKLDANAIDAAAILMFLKSRGFNVSMPSGFNDKGMLI